MTPSPPQLKALQQMRAGATLVFRKSPIPSVNLEAPNGVEWMLIHPSTAGIIVANGWATLNTFNPNRGTYRLHQRGLDLTDAFCEHTHDRDNSMTEMAGRMVCLNCWMVVPCGVARPGQNQLPDSLHPAEYWVWGRGAICESHSRRMVG